MVGSHGSNPHSGLTRRLLAVLALLALVGTACGAESESATASAAPAEADVDYGPSDSSADANTAPEAFESPSGNAAEVASSQAPALGKAGEESSPPTAVPAPKQTAQVLAYAIEAGEGQSYSFEQGMSIQMNMLGMNLDISPEAAFAVGEVSGGDSRVRVDLGLFMTELFEEMGLDMSNPMFAGAFGDFEVMQMEVWIVDSTMVIDMSSLASSLAGLDPAAASELSVFADGPVSVDLAAIGGLGTIDATALVQQFGQGAQVTDPAALIGALRAVEAVTETGSSTVGDTEVTVYEASLSMADYYDALGLDVTDQLGSLEDFGVGAGTNQAEMIESMLPGLQELTVDLTIMLDADGLVRRIESHMDMGAMMGSMLSETEGASAVGSTDILVDTWQDFTDYGTDITITAPEAVDRTSELSGLLDA